MSDIQKGVSFVPGDTVTDVKLNNLVDNATILPAFISAKVALTVEPTEDYLLVYEGDTTTLKKVLASNMPGVASVGLSCAIPGTNVTNVTPTGPLVSIAIGHIAQLPGKFLGSPSGASGLPVYRVLESRDMATPVHTIPAWDIDWSLSTTHYKAISASGTFTFNSGGAGLAVDGQTIQVLVGQAVGAKTVSWPALRWENGVVPVLTPGAGRSDLFQFWWLVGQLFGKRILQNV